MKQLFCSRLFVGFLVFLLVFCQPLFVYAAISTNSNAFAVNPHYLIGSASNADPYRIATMELTDEDYFIQPFSSVGTVTNTVEGGLVRVQYTNGTYTNSSYITPQLINNRWRFSFSIPSSMNGYWIDEVDYYLQSAGCNFDALPSPPGDYTFAIDFSSDISYGTYTKNLKWNIFSAFHPDNADFEYSYVYVTPQFDSGDFYISPLPVKFMTGYSNVRLRTYVRDDDLLKNFGGSYAIQLTKTSEPGEGLVGSDLSYGDITQDMINNTLGDMSSTLDSVDGSLEYISTSQNLIIQGIDNVIMHISDQLYAFWDQLYNLIHEPTYARLGDILDAIRNLDLEITVEMTEVTNAVNKMNQEVQNKLQQTTDKITGGFDNSVMESEATKLDNSISEYDEAEQSVIQNVNDSLDNFEFDAELGEYQSIVSVISDFLQELYDSSGGFKVLINLSMLLSLAGIVIGIYRFGGGS